MPEGSHEDPGIDLAAVSRAKGRSDPCTDPPADSKPERHRLPLRVYYEDTDFSGVVYHARYLHFLERGRTEWLRHHKIDQMALFAGRDAPALAFVVAHMSLDFRKPAQMDDLLNIETEVLRLKPASLLLGQRVLRGESLLVEARVKIAAVSAGRVTRLPLALRSALGSPLLPAEDSPI